MTKQHYFNLEEQIKLIYDFFLQNNKVDFVEKNFSDIADFLSGYSFSKKDFSKKGIYKILTIKNIKNLGIEYLTENEINYIPENIPKHCILNIGDILMTLTGNVGRTSIVYDTNFLLNQRICVIKPKKDWYNTFILFSLKSDKVFKALQNLSNGSSQSNLSPLDASQTKILWNETIVKKFDIKTKPLIKNIIKNLKQNQILIQLRDFLLPILMNGQATIED